MKQIEVNWGLLTPPQWQQIEGQTDSESQNVVSNGYIRIPDKAWVWNVQVVIKTREIHETKGKVESIVTSVTAPTAWTALWTQASTVRSRRLTIPALSYIPTLSILRKWIKEKNFIYYSEKTRTFNIGKKDQIFQLMIQRRPFLVNKRGASIDFIVLITQISLSCCTYNLRTISRSYFIEINSNFMSPRSISHYIQ